MTQLVTLSEAIRKGCGNRPQIKGAYYDSSMALKKPDTCGVCAIGAAQVYLKGKVKGCYPSIHGQDPNHIKLYYNTLLKCPQAGCSETEKSGLLNMVFHLNDQHEWGFYQIADYVATVENGLRFVKEGKDETK